MDVHVCLLNKTVEEIVRLIVFDKFYFSDVSNLLIICKYYNKSIQFIILLIILLYVIF